MKTHDLIPGIIGGVAGYAVLKFGTDDGAAMALLGFAIAFAICCHIGQAVTSRAVIAGLIAVPAGVFSIGLLHMDMAGYENGAVIMGGLVFLFASGSYQVGKKCKPATPKITQGQS
jgi:hypothetical protein